MGVSLYSVSLQVIHLEEAHKLLIVKCAIILKLGEYMPWYMWR
jgi:hypothetical protein